MKSSGSKIKKVCPASEAKNVNRNKVKNIFHDIQAKKIFVINHVEGFVLKTINLYLDAKKIRLVRGIYRLSCQSIMIKIVEHHLEPVRMERVVSVAEDVG